jgi:hypothetical protein
MVVSSEKRSTGAGEYIMSVDEYLVLFQIAN